MHLIVRNLESQRMSEFRPRKIICVTHVSSERGGVHVMCSTVVYCDAYMPATPKNIAWACFRDRAAPGGAVI